VIRNFYLFLILFFCCENPLTNIEEQHCILDLGGFFDDCGICSGGLTNHIPNSSKDCDGVCFGSAIFDQCYECNGNNSTCDSSLDNYCDLDNGEFWDDCGNCIGVNDIENEFMDDCGICLVDQSTFDQLENNLMDLCGICNGNNSSCNYGLLTFSEWQFSQIKLWNNDTCYGNPYYVMNDFICLENEGSCFSYSINFDINYEYGILVFTQTIQFTNGTEVELNGQWSLNIEGCSGLYLDYDNLDYQDGCYHEIDIQNTYSDCVMDLSLCSNNIISLSTIDDENETCSKEILNTEVELNMNSNIITNDMLVYFPFYFKNIFTYIENFSNK